MSSIKEIQNAIKVIRKFHNKIIILHCISNYPTNLKDSNLERINKLKKIFKNYKIGISDHTNDIFSSIASYSYGVVAIEKHYNLDNKKTTDSEFSITPKKLKLLSQILKDLSSKPKSNQQIDKNMKKLRRSIFATKNIKKNERFNPENIETYRPKIGLCASNYFEIIGKKSKKNIRKGFPIFKESVSNH